MVRASRDIGDIQMDVETLLHCLDECETTSARTLIDKRDQIHPLPSKVLTDAAQKRFNTPPVKT